jgi:protein SCO1/2
MVNIASALEKVPADIADQIRVVFVTTDPTRDSAKVLRAWLDNFDRRFIGLRGSEVAIKAAQAAAGIPPSTRTVLADGKSEIGHAAFVLAYSKDNLAHLIYPGGITEQDWAHDLVRLVKDDWSSH